MKRLITICLMACLIVTTGCSLSLKKSASASINDKDVVDRRIGTNTNEPDLISLGIDTNEYRKVNFGTQGGKPISWYVILDEDDAMVLMSEKLVDTIKYHDKNENVDWSNSTLHEYLNSEFINLYFSKEERDRILYTNSVDDDIVTMPTINNILDLFGKTYYVLPNYYNNKEFYEPNKKMIAKPGEIAINNEIEVFDNEIYEQILQNEGKDDRYDFANGYSAYWLLNGVDGGTEKYIVTATGYIGGIEPDTEYIGIRPIIRIKK